MNNEYLITEWFYPSDPIESQWGTLECSIWAEREAKRIRAGFKLIPVIIYNKLDGTIAIANSELWNANDKEEIWRNTQ